MAACLAGDALAAGPLDWLATVLFTGVLGAMAAGVARHGKARHPGWTAHLGMVLGGAGWYAQWAAWLAIAEAGSFASLLGDPQAMFRCALAWSETHIDHVAGMPIERSVRLAGWIVELLVLTCVPRALAHTVAEQPFCELANAWATACELPCRFAWVDAQDVVVHRLESHPAQCLSILARCTGAAATRYSIARLHRCGADLFLSVDNVRIHGRGRRTTKISEPVVACLRLPGMDADQLIRDCT